MLAQNPANPPPEQTGDQNLNKLSLRELMDVEVTSVSRQPEKLLEVPSAVQVITNEDMHRSGATRIPEALRLADNLDVAQKNSHDWGISARGFNTELANKLLVMIDGRTVYTPLFSGVFWSQQDYLLEDLDRIEVVSGPGGSVWGANAVNGVISILSKSARETQGVYAEAGGGNVLQSFAGARYGGVLAPGVYYRVFGKFINDGHEVLPAGTSFPDSWRRRQGGFRIDSERSAQNTLTLQGDLYGVRDNLPAGEDTSSGRNILARWVHTVSPSSDLELQSYYDHTHIAQPAPPLVINGRVFAPAGLFRDDLDTYDVDFQHRIRSGEKNNLIWGLGYRTTRDVSGNAPSLGFLPEHLTQNLFSGFAQDEVALHRNVFLTIGSKVEHNDYTGFEIEPSIRLQWNWNSEQTFWGAVSRAVRAPSRIDRDLSNGVPPFFVLLTGGRDFSSESVIAWETGWRAKLGSRADASVSLFYNHYQDVRSTSFTPTTLFPLFFANNLEGETHGLEVSTTWQATGSWRLHAGYALLEEHLQVKPGRTDVNNALNEVSDPRQHLSLRSSMDLPHRVGVDLMLRWVGDRPGHNGPTPGTLDGYVDLDARIGWYAAKQVELSLVGQNLLHDHHPEYGFPTAVRAEIRRSMLGRVAWRF